MKLLCFGGNVRIKDLEEVRRILPGTSAIYSFEEPIAACAKVLVGEDCDATTYATLKRHLFNFVRELDQPESLLHTKLEQRVASAKEDWLIVMNEHFQEPDLALMKRLGGSTTFVGKEEHRNFDFTISERNKDSYLNAIITALVKE